MKRLGSLVAVVVLAACLALWQARSVADNAQPVSPTAVKSGSCCKSKAAAKDSASTAAEKPAGCPMAAKAAATGEKSASTACNKSAKSGCPFAAASATQPAAVATTDKSGCCSGKASLAAYTAEEGQPRICPRTGEKCEHPDRKCGEDCQKKCCGDKSKCPKAGGEGCAKACEKSCPKATAQAGCPKAAAQAGCPMAAAATRPSDAAEKAGCSVGKAKLAAAAAEPKSSGCSKSGCSKRKTSVAAATQPAGSSADQAGG